MIEDILRVTQNLLSERGKSYDDGKERSMGKTVRAFNAITGNDLTEEQGWLFMMLLKQVRSQTSKTPHEDSVRDLVSYSVLLAECSLDKLNALEDERFQKLAAEKKKITSRTKIGGGGKK